MLPSSLTIIFLTIINLCSSNTYQFGLGMFDITGPAADVNMMGYAKLTQNTGGIHTRLYSRAFLIADDKPGAKPVLFINLDVGMTSQLLKTQVVTALRQKYGEEFDHQNVLISATHTHSGPGGYFQYFLYTVTSLGLVKENLDILVHGIVKSVELAKSNTMKGRILINSGDLLNASINRSPASYLLNPPDERHRFEHNVDTRMILLKFVAQSGQPVGMLNWFAVHATSMNNSNHLISSDNKGLASVLFEELMNKHRRVGKGPFIAAFAQANEGDVSPNINGPRCIDTGLPCDFIYGTCNGHASKCIAFGPGKDMFESTQIIAQRQVEKAWELFESAKEELNGPVSFVHQFVDMTNVNLEYKGKQVKTCKPAMGYSFAAGTMDGPGDFDFTQGTTATSTFWNFVRNLIKKPSPELDECHSPKPILFATGEISHPLPWQPAIVETQIIRIGNLLIVGLPGEFTTMSGRRIREAVEKTYDCPFAFEQRENKAYVALAGLSNVYTSYIATPEEYQLQRYEGASTIYGPYTLPAYVEQFSKLAAALKTASKLPVGPIPPNLLDKLPSYLPSVWFDSAGLRKYFGQVLIQPRDLYENPSDTVAVRFVTANPRNNPRQNDTFLTIDRYDERKQEWIVMYTDANWETRFYWSRPAPFGFLAGQSVADITWQVSTWDGLCIPGTYRIRHFGRAKDFLPFQSFRNFVGVTKSFKVTCGKGGLQATL